MSIAQIIFYIFAGITVISALMILFTRNVLYSAFLLIVTFLGVAAIYVFAGADFLAITQILVYVGGILVLMIFGVMLTNKISGQAVMTEGQHHFWAALIGLSLFGLLSYTILQVNFSSLAWIQAARNANEQVQESTIQRLGILLMSDFVLPFELAGVLLLIALIGAAFIAKRQLD
ncbi:NADH:ubiquinone oxidoreductase subunit 6 (subunit J) [Catalinimonas alkaloidigena]|uniref:NADH-quinone oxidoreductase subunit J family protein n=1 Tax=Catalinimonas alkaloidigena TaxID=1075417 RepID=UPI002406F0E1|nr:NADH-quinone oxidoreductase subunit J [Catalinimonas alkaloidigena]MDF9801021.1 NADH:ubiquinone oxidoreductase subunit 6 (subunit J) [Catalinimonas alkaloidigena]